MKEKISDSFLNLYEKLFEHYGEQHWWPADSLLEMIVGAILTQNTAWANVETAIKNIKKNNLLDLETLTNSKPEKLAKLIKCTGYYNIKSKRLINFLSYLKAKTNNNLANLYNTPFNVLRNELLDQPGIGPETADSILLYGGNQPIFVVDNYTRRIFKRHGLITGNETYDEIRIFSEKYLPPNIKIYQELHALIVRAGAEQCKTKPICFSCPLENWRATHINVEE